MTSASVTVGGRRLTLSHLDKVIYPATGFTKGQMVEYYQAVAPFMLAHLEGRPLTMKRFPQGAAGPSFYEKNAPPGTPAWVRRIAVPKKEGGEVDYSVVGDLATLIWAVNLDVIEFHVPPWRVPPDARVPGPPDHLIFDLDPGEGTSIVECCVVAEEITRRLGARGLEALAKTSGRKGLQVYAPLAGGWDWSRARGFARDLARELERERPGLVVANMRRRVREGRVLIDWSQNSPTKSTVAVYSLRAGPEPTVSTPVTPEEVANCARSGVAALLRFGPDDVRDRLVHRKDLFFGV